MVACYSVAGRTTEKAGRNHHRRIRVSLVGTADERAGDLHGRRNTRNLRRGLTQNFNSKTTNCNSPQDADNCIIRFCFLHLWDIRTNTESVSLFLCNERRKFDRRGSKPTTCRVISLYGIGVGLLLILSSRFPTTCYNEMSFQHHAFCLLKSKN